VTREEAIERLEDTFEGWNMWVMDNDSPASKMSKALNMAISALREQEERSKGCSACDGGFGDNTMVFYAGGYKHCPMCGRRLEDT
jgi:hypothetical protein